MLLFQFLEVQEGVVLGEEEKITKNVHSMIFG